MTNTTVQSTSIRRTGFSLAAGLAAALALSAPATADIPQDLIDAARAERSMTLYTNIDPRVLQNLADRFQQVYGVTVDIQRQGSSALAQRFMAEQQAGNIIADAYYSTDRAFHEDRVADGTFAAVGDIPGVATWPAEALAEGVITVGHVPYSIVWNTDLVPDGVADWSELADPRWEGQLMMTDPRSGVTSNQFYLMLRDLYGDDYLRALGRNATYSPSAVPGIQQVAAGAQAIYVPGIHQIVVGLTERGAPLGESFPEPTISSNNLLSIVAQAPRPNAARLFAAFLMTPEGQEINNFDGFSPLSGIPNTREMPRIVEVSPADAQAASAELARLLGL